MLATIDFDPLMSIIIPSLDLYQDIFLSFFFEFFVILIFWAIYHWKVYYNPTNKLSSASVIILGTLVFLHIFFSIPSFLDVPAIDLDVNRLAAGGILAIELSGILGFGYLHNRFTRS